MDEMARRPFSSMQAAALATDEVVARRHQHSRRALRCRIFSETSGSLLRDERL
jgi:hypothetical protein